MLLDVMLPDVDGLEVCRCLTADSATRTIPAKRLRRRRPGIRVLYMSGYAGDVCDGSMLRKPFATPALLAAVGKSLEESS